MNKQHSPLILYIFIILILVTEILLFVFKDRIGDYLINYRVDGDLGAVTGQKLSSDIDLGILRDSRVKPLKNYVTVFNYSDLNKSQDALQAAATAAGDVAITNPDNQANATTTKAAGRVRAGNGNPFIILSKTR